MRTFADMKEEEFEAEMSTPERKRSFKKLLFAVAFFNGKLRRERERGERGWGGGLGGWYTCRVQMWKMVGAASFISCCP